MPKGIDWKKLGLRAVQGALCAYTCVILGLGASTMLRDNLDAFTTAGTFVITIFLPVLNIIVIAEINDKIKSKDKK